MTIPRGLLVFSISFFAVSLLPSAESITVQRGGLFHSGMLTSSSADDGFGDLRKRIEELAGQWDAEIGDVAKLNLYSSRSDAKSLEVIRRSVEAAWPDKTKRPAVTLVPSQLPGDAVLAADVVIPLDDVAKSLRPLIDKTGAVLPPGCDAVYISGRAASGELAEATAGTMKQLFDVLGHIGSGRENIVQVKAFIKPMPGWETVKSEIEKSFEGLPLPPILIVEWTSGSRATEIELIATAPATENAEGPITYFTPPGDRASPVYSRVARISGDRIIYLGGLTGPDNSSAAKEVHSLFAELKRVAEAAGSDLRHFAKATYYVSESGVSKALNELRPEYYDPKRPPAASKVQVTDIGVANRGILIDMVAVPVK